MGEELLATFDLHKGDDGHFVRHGKRFQYHHTLLDVLKWAQSLDEDADISDVQFVHLA